MKKPKFITSPDGTHGSFGIDKILIDGLKMLEIGTDLSENDEFNFQLRDLLF